MSGGSTRLITDELLVEGVEGESLKEERRLDRRGEDGELDWREVIPRGKKVVGFGVGTVAGIEAGAGAGAGAIAMTPEVVLLGAIATCFRLGPLSSTAFRL